MAFGVAIDGGSKSLDLTYGYIVSFDLTAQELRDFSAAQVVNGSTVSAQINTETDKDVLFSYPNDASCPDLAWSVDGKVVYIFVNKSKFPYVLQTEIAFWYVRNALNVIDTTSKVDVEQEARRLLLKEIEIASYESVGKPVPQRVIDERDRELELLGLL